MGSDEGTIVIRGLFVWHLYFQFLGFIQRTFAREVILKPFNSFKPLKKKKNKHGCLKILLFDTLIFKKKIWKPNNNIYFSYTTCTFFFYPTTAVKWLQYCRYGVKHNPINLLYNYYNPVYATLYPTIKSHWHLLFLLWCCKHCPSPITCIVTPQLKTMLWYSNQNRIMVQCQQLRRE